MSNKEIRLQARTALKNNTFKAILAFCIASLCGACGGGLSITFSYPEPQEAPPVQGDIPPLEILYPVLIFAGIFLIVYFLFALIVGSGVSVGYAVFNLDLVDGFTVRIGTLFSRFYQVGTAIRASLLIFVKVFFGFLLFFVPGVIASYRYAMVYHVIAENPGITAREALQKSRDIMRFNKWKLFCLHFSFIGWNLLEAITLGIAAYWVEPYRHAAVAAFYRDIR